MHYWTCYLALFAYLIGGWIAPSSHCHVHVDTQDSSAFHQFGANPCGETDQSCKASEASPQLSVRQSCCCSATDVPQSPASKASADPTLNSQLAVFQGGIAADCDGLCCICVSQSLVSDSIVATVVPAGSNVQRNSIVTSISDTHSPRLGVTCPRGPPSDV